MTKTAMIVMLACCIFGQVHAQRKTLISRPENNPNMLLDSVVRYVDNFPHMSKTHLLTPYTVSKEAFTYDSKKNIIQHLIQSKNSLNDPAWMNTEKADQTFDANNNMLTQTVYHWHKNTHEWVGSERMVQEFDSRSNLLTKSTYVWNEKTQKWDGQDRMEVTYNERNDKTTQIFYNDMLNNEWVLSGKKVYKYTYRDSDYEEEEEGYYWMNDGEGWGMYSKKKCVYDYHKNLKEIYYAKDLVNYTQKDVYESAPDAPNAKKISNANLGYQSYNWDGTSWVLGTSLHLGYSALGAVLQKTYIERDDTKGDLRKKTEESYTYDVYENVSSYTLREGNRHNEWSNKRLVKYTYDASNNPITEVTHYWDRKNGVWKAPIVWKYENVYKDNRWISCTAYRGEEGVWQPYSMENVVYDAYGNIVLSETYWRKGKELALGERSTYYFRTASNKK